MLRLSVTPVEPLSQLSTLPVSSVPITVHTNTVLKRTHHLLVNLYIEIESNKRKCKRLNLPKFMLFAELYFLYFEESDRPCHSPSGVPLLIGVQ